MKSDNKINTININRK